MSTNDWTVRQALFDVIENEFDVAGYHQGKYMMVSDNVELLKEEMERVLYEALCQPPSPTRRAKELVQEVLGAHQFVDRQSVARCEKCREYIFDEDNLFVGEAETFHRTCLEEDELLELSQYDGKTIRILPSSCLKALSPRKRYDLKKYDLWRGELFPAELVRDGDHLHQRGVPCWYGRKDNTIWLCVRSDDLRRAEVILFGT